MGRNLTDLSRWLGQDAEPLDPEKLQYRSAPAQKGAGDCAGCAFRGQMPKVCKAANAAAVRAGWSDCDDKDPETGRTFVYHLVPVDPRQISIE